jgi:hypothetical protein
MNSHVFCTFVALVLSAMLQPAFAQSRQTLKQLDELDRKCEAARDAVLPGIREQLIAECILPPPTRRVRARTLEECEHYWNDFGVMQRQRAALDLPECKEAFQARQQHRSR